MIPPRRRHSRPLDTGGRLLARAQLARAQLTRGQLARAQLVEPRLVEPQPLV